MKKILAILTVLTLLCGQAWAFEGKNYPSWDGGVLPGNAAAGGFGAEDLLLAFDSTADFSFASDGLAQLCFYAQSEDMLHYLELYLILPLDVAAGEEITEISTRAGACSVSLYEVSPTSETLFYGGQLFGLPYPENVEFEIRIDAAEYSADSFSVRGRLSAKLCRMQNDQPAAGAIAVENVEFDCTLPLGSAGTPTPTPGINVSAPEAAPKFTLPPDYITL